MSSISVEELEMIFQRILEKLRQEGIDDLNFENDTYRIIPTESWNDFTVTEVDICSLYDDLDNIRELARDETRFCTYVDFDRVASILRAISQNRNPVDG